MQAHSIWLAFLSVMFVFWNSVRILTYVPTIRKLTRPGASARDYSLATWGSWVLSNGFFALYLWEQAGRELNSMVLLNAGNTAMCLVTCVLIHRLQRRESMRQPNGDRPGAVRAGNGRGPDADDGRVDDALRCMPRRSAVRVVAAWPSPARR